MLAAHLETIAGLRGDAAYVLDQALHDGPVPANNIASALDHRVHRHDPTAERWVPSEHITTPRRPPEPIPGIHHHDRGIPI